MQTQSVELFLGPFLNKVFLHKLYVRRINFISEIIPTYGIMIID